ncbi:GtrA family protein [Patescibacteria group bacterium]|nr:GtrA family protein [Patescibacteria group bacterium]MBU4481325.1 GtrA family protein [Patescibacteria group bacterium]
MKKTDAKISIIIGFLIGVFFFIILKNIGIKIPYLWILMIVFPPLSLLGMFIISLLGKRFLIILQIGKFLLVGALNTFIDMGVLNILIWISGIASGVWYSIFKGISFLIATTNSYLWNKHWTFEKRKEVFAPGEFSKFLILTTIGFSINVGIASFVVNVIGPQLGLGAKIWANVGAFTAVLVAWFWNFLGAKFIVFKK